MSHLTRRSFVKRTGAVTLGSALGLGVLPSVTRKLHATDTSTILSNIRANPVSLDELLDYPPVSSVGKMRMNIAVASTIGTACGAATIMSVNREAVYTQVAALLNSARQPVLDSSGNPIMVTYTGRAAISSVATWSCQNGMPAMTTPGHDTSKKDGAVEYVNGDQRVSLGTVRTEMGPGLACLRARMFWQDSGEYGPFVERAGSFSAVCC